MSGRDETVDALSLDQLRAVLKALKRQVNAAKRVYFSHRGVVTASRVLPDHKVRLRALNELAKLHGLHVLLLIEKQIVGLIGGDSSALKAPEQPGSLHAAAQRPRIVSER